MDFNFQNSTPFSQVPVNRCWTKYTNIINVLSNEQRSFVASNKEVIEAKSKMMSAFIDYLFTQHRDAFVSVSDGAYLEIAENYIETIQRVAESYVPRTQKLEEENLAMKKRIDELIKKIESIEPMNKGSKHGTDISTADGNR